MNEIRSPSYEQIDAVASAFETLADNPAHQVDMAEANIRRDECHPCGTIACHGGWYLYHKMLDGPHRWVNHEMTPEGEYHPIDGAIMTTEPYCELPDYIADVEEHPNYCDGALAMALDLGFESEEQMLAFFEEHPDIWGNKHARKMFHSQCAFNGVPTLGMIRLSDIARQWRGVADRIRERRQ